MKVGRHVGLQALIFFLVSSAFATIYITQPVLPVIRSEFGVSASTASLTVSAVIFGIALATLPFGRLADTLPVRPILFTGGSVVIGCSLFCAATENLPLLVLARFLQGLFIPSLTTCLVVHLVRSLPQERLNVVMGSYVSATVAGGLGGRLPFYLAGPDFRASTQVITLMYLSYVIGVVIGPLAGNASDRIGNGATIALGSAVFALAILVTFLPSMIAC